MKQRGICMHDLPFGASRPSRFGIAFCGFRFLFLGNLFSLGEGLYSKGHMFLLRADQCHIIEQSSGKWGYYGRTYLDSQRGLEEARDT